MQIGTIEYEARVTGVAEAKQNAQDFADTQEEVASSSENAAVAGGFLAGTLSTVGDETEEVGEKSDRTSAKSDILTSSLYFLGTTAIGTVAKLTGLAGILGTIKTALAGITLSGIMGSVTGAVSSFVGWLAAGSAGALAFAGAIGAAIGIVGVWILEVTGALDAVRGFGQFVAGILPGWVRDGVLQVISIFAGPLAVIGGFIVGFVQGGFDEAFAKAGQIVDIFIGSWSRQIDRVAGIFWGGIDALAGAWNWVEGKLTAGFNTVVGWFEGGVDTVENAFWGGVRGLNDGWNWVEDKLTAGIDFIVGKLEEIVEFLEELPDRIADAGAAAADAVPGSDIAGAAGRWAGGGLGDLASGEVNLPSLQHGGTVEDTGVAQVHEGEFVGTPEVLAAGMGGSGGGGGDTVVVENVTLRLTGNFDPTDLSRRELEDLADKVARAIGKKTNTRAGVR